MHLVGNRVLFDHTERDVGFPISIERAEALELLFGDMTTKRHSYTANADELFQNPQHGNDLADLAKCTQKADMIGRYSVVLAEQLSEMTTYELVAEVTDYLKANTTES